MRRASMAVAVTLLCALLAGCGGSGPSTAKFKSDYVSVTASIEPIGADMARAVEQASHYTPSQIASQFSTLADRFATQLIQLEALSPPSSVTGAFSKLTAAANRLEDDLRAISNAATVRNGGTAVSEITSLVHDANAMNASAATIRQKLGIK